MVRLVLLHPSLAHGWRSPDAYNAKNGSAKCGGYRHATASRGGWTLHTMAAAQRTGTLGLRGDLALAFCAFVVLDWDMSLDWRVVVGTAAARTVDVTHSHAHTHARDVSLAQGNRRKHPSTTNAMQSASAGSPPSRALSGRTASYAWLKSISTQSRAPHDGFGRHIAVWSRRGCALPRLVMWRTARRCSRTR